LSRSIEWKSDFVTNNGNKIHYYRTGGDKPPVLLLHGVMDNGLCWTPLGRVLASDYDVILPDARGHGLTHISDETWTYEAMADDVALLIKDLNVDKIQLVGHSMGADTAALVAAKYPDLIKKIVLEDPGFSMSEISSIKKSSFKIAMKLILPRFLNSTYEELLKKGHKQTPLWSDEDLKPWAESKIQFREKDPNLIFKMFKNEYKWEEIIKKISCPILLITADKGLTSDKLAQKVMDVSKAGKWVKIEGAGHSIRREQFKQYVQITKEFLD